MTLAELMQLRSDRDNGVLLCRKTIDALIDHAIAREKQPVEVERGALSFGYEGGCAYTSEIGGSVSLHYQTGEQAEAAFVAITDIIDAAITSTKE